MRQRYPYYVALRNPIDFLVSRVVEVQSDCSLVHHNPALTAVLRLGRLAALVRIWVVEPRPEHCPGHLQGEWP